MDKQLEPRVKEQNDRLETLIIVLRDYLMDHAEINHLIEGEEFSDNQLRTALLLALDHYNSRITPISITATVMTFPSLSLWLDGGAVYAIKTAIHKYIRNAFQYNDASVQVAVEEKSGAYEQTLQRLLTEFTDSCRAVKENINLESCYGGFSSEYLALYIVGRRNIARKV